ncbi:class I SAM-dependent methyltransferase [Leptospira wolffii]|uniref:2-polyprenyl-3-methyl-5-hydroxy-6-metoxy-1, 4-benzoquinol methylase n=1 Tax=Leptospira wolffii TaxID=409998 RepID=A0A2M9Z7F1_9LEPT|nr:class I SAM-dependent methyltransferase [Leptospira wolffii]PJZ64356.1 2-polyprenyl-3-methyl-5-hydroxy-6-metoxy-1,4-benzoquinol methylase [Leptospira wolffii]TGK58318.1 class I SAM-dependent methyltransferase [Leptospira wolffii]TGK66305.1 class I SAM-dependent methyltransferase [Leptospira wolffii]TGK68996.1 class I SAM-dependent methyltransferase [Leptospira wolffii]TGL27348.1 class I SAM-dependent methyltransferase [Leptospira wolffii]
MSSILELEPHPDFPDAYMVCRRTGVHFYRLAKERKYEDSYFQEEYKNQYKKTYYEDEAQLRRLAGIRLDMMSSFQNPEGLTLFELGCAAGFFLSEAAKRGYKVKGLELSKSESEYARNNLGLDVLSGSFLDDSVLPDEKFDAVCAFFVIEHFPDAEDVFARITNLVKPGGLLFLGLPSLNGPSFRTNPLEWLRTHPSDHFWDYSPNSLEKMLKMYGFVTLCKKPMSYHPQRDRGWKGKYLTQSLFVRYANLSCYADTFHSIAIKKT